MTHTTGSHAASGGKLVEVQGLRAIAVMLVVFGHSYLAEQRFLAPALAGDAALAGFAGVDVFFVISGFIIHFLYGNGRPVDARYYLKRINRIYPLYWIYTVLALLGYGVMADSLSRSPGELDILASFSLLPTTQPPVLIVGWTLTHELYFYFAYGLAFALPRAWRLPAAAIWGLASLAFTVVVHAPLLAWLNLLFSPFNLLFLAGIVLAELQHHLARFRWTALLIALGGATLALIAAGMLGLDGLANRGLRVAVFAPFAIGLVWTFLAWRPGMPRLLSSIGDWSYSIYLSHVLVIGVLARLMAPYLPGLPAHSLFAPVILVGASLMFGLLSYRFVERPLLRLGAAGIRRVTRPADGASS